MQLWKQKVRREESLFFSPHCASHVCPCVCMSCLHGHTQSTEASDLSTHWPGVQQPTPRRTDWAVCWSPREMCVIWEEEVRWWVCADGCDPVAQPVPWNLHVTPFISEHIPCRGHNFEYKVPKKSVVVSFSRCRTLVLKLKNWGTAVTFQCTVCCRLSMTM